MNDTSWRTLRLTPLLAPKRAAWPAVALASGLVLGVASQAAWAAAEPQPAKPASVPAPAALPSFDVYQYVVEGNSVLSALDIETAVAEFLGERKTLRDVEAARAALEKRYHDAGYLTVLVSIPDQAVDAGEVRLQVVEAVVDRLKVAGAAYTLPSGLKANVPELAEGKVPNFNKMQEQLATLNRRPDARVTPVLRAGKLPGTVEVQLDVDDQLPLHGSLEFSNRQTPNTTANRLSGSVRYDNLWQLGHSLGLMLQTAPQRTTDARVAALTYVLPSGRGNDVLSIYAVHSRSEFASLANAPGLGLLGNSDTLGMRYTMPLSGSAESSQTLAAGFDYKNVKQTIKVQDGSTSDSPIAYLPLVASYSANLFGAERSSALDVSATLGLRGLAGNTDKKFDTKRSGASAGYVALRTGLQHTESLQRWSLYGKLDLQLATGPLVPTEQFVAGGAESVRGYLEGERSGDMGVRATLELRTPQFNLGGAGSAWRLGGQVFIDGARLETLRPVAPQPGHHYLSGAGFGLRASAPGGFSFDLDAARALLAGDTTLKHSTRVHARAIWGY